MSERTVCVNDTDGDGDCAACTRNPQAPCRVSARDEIFKRLAGAFISDEKANALIDAFAHELAERGREEYLRLVRLSYHAPAQRAFDLIDPMKESDRGHQ